MGSCVLLLEADLRRPTIAQQLDLPSGPGIADVLIGSVALGEAIQSVDLDSPSGQGGSARGVRRARGGCGVPNPGELIEPIGDRLTRWSVCSSRPSRRTTWS
jgi:hypothetical protein